MGHRRAPAARALQRHAHLLHAVRARQVGWGGGATGWAGRRGWERCRGRGTPAAPPRLASSSPARMRPCPHALLYPHARAPARSLHAPPRSPEQRLASRPHRSAHCPHEPRPSLHALPALPRLQPRAAPGPRLPGEVAVEPPHHGRGARAQEPQRVPHHAPAPRVQRVAPPHHDDGCARTQGRLQGPQPGRVPLPLLPRAAGPSPPSAHALAAPHHIAPPRPPQARRCRTTWRSCRTCCTSCCPPCLRPRASRTWRRCCRRGRRRRGGRAGWNGGTGARGTSPASEAHPPLEPPTPRQSCRRSAPSTTRPALAFQRPPQPRRATTPR